MSLLLKSSGGRYQLGILLASSPHSRRTKLILLEHTAFLPPRTLSATPPSSSLYLNVRSQYLETHFTQNLQWPHLPGSQKIFLPGNTQPFPNNKGIRNQGPECAHNKEKPNISTWNYDPPNQMPRCQHNNTNSDKHNSESALSPGTPPQQALWTAM